MSKEVQMSIKLEPELRGEFLAAARALKRPADELLRELMRSFLAQRGGDSLKTPNAETVAAMEAGRRGEGERAESVDALFEALGVV